MPPKLFAGALVAGFSSVRGKRAFGNNQFPVQHLHIFLVAGNAKGQAILKTASGPWTAHRDACAAECAKP